MEALDCAFSYSYVGGVPWRDLTQYCTGDKPAARALHAAAVIGSKMFVFGGKNENQELNGLFRLDLGTILK